MTFIQKLESAPLEKRWNMLRELVQQYIREILFIPEDKGIENDRGFFELGLDSFTAIQLRDKLRASFGEVLNIETTKIFDYPNVNELCKYMCSIIPVSIPVPKDLQEKSKTEVKVEAEELSDEELFRQLTEETDKNNE